MIRVFLGVIFAFTAIVFVLFLWQKQIKGYHFSLEKEKQVFEGFGEEVNDLKKNVPSKDRVTNDLKAFERQFLATNTLEFATSSEDSASTVQ